MPTYLSKCHSCGLEHDYIRKVDDRNETPDCCGVKTERMLVAPAIGAMGLTSGSFSMVSPIDGATIHGKSEYEAHMRKHNVRPASEYDGQAEHVRKTREAEHKKEVRAAATEAVQKALNK